MILTYEILAYIYGMPPEWWDPNLTTIATWAFGIPFETSILEVDPTAIKLLLAKKKVNPELKCLISIGGWGTNFDTAMASKENQIKFAANCQTLLEEYQLDGLDIDCEYPTSKQRGEFTELIKEIRKAIGVEKILTIATPAAEQTTERFDLKELGRWCDYINVMCYDYDYGTKNRHQANLVLGEPYGAEISNQRAIRMHLQAGVPSRKLLMGMPFYGRIGQEAKSYDLLVGEYINKNGYFSLWDQFCQAAYLIKDGAFAGTYDYEYSIKIKCDYLKQEQLGGGFFWELLQNTNQVLLTTMFNNLRR